MSAHRDPLISVKEARKIAGTAVISMTDDELIQFLLESETLVTTILESFLRSKNDKIESIP